MEQKQLLFVDSISTVDSEEGGVRLSLLPVGEYNPQIEIPRYLSRIEFQKAGIKEGQYVFYEKGDFSNGNTSKVAKGEIMRNAMVRYRLLQKDKDKSFPPISLDTEDASIYSYHVNVGHGNCSIIVQKKEDGLYIIMVDCSERENSKSHSHWPNIDKCIKHIEEKHNHGVQLHIDRILITHPHYDHYSGMEKLIDDKYIDSKTIFFINLYYHMPAGAYTDLLEKIEKLRCIIIEPKKSNSDSIFSIFHPHKTVAKKKIKGMEVDRVSNANNASVVCLLRFGENSIVFTGDIEKRGWKKLLSDITNCDECRSIFFPTYYCISHHGSENGHCDKEKLCELRGPTHAKSGHFTRPGNIIRNVFLCRDYRVTYKDAILMGRDGSYHGIYCRQVLSAYHMLHKTESCPAFIEMDWATNQSTTY